MKGIVLGIDLGTTNSAISICRENGKVEIVPTENGHLLRSVVCFQEDKSITIGEAATMKKKLIKSGNVVFNSKRLIGMNYNCASDDNKLCFASVVSGPDNTSCFKIPNLNNAIRSPEDIASLLIKKLIEYAEKLYTDDRIVSAVVTVPAQFTQEQKLATKRAAEKILKIGVHLINEPTAAALAYHEENKLENKKIVVFDLGGGTFDVSVVEVEGNKFRILNYDGSLIIGGQSFDAKILAHIQEKYNISTGGDDLLPDKNDERYFRIYYTLLDRCRIAKESLSYANVDSMPIDLEGYNRDDDVQEEEEEEDCDEPEDATEIILSRTELDDIIESDTNDMINIVNRCIKDSKVEKDKIDKVVLIGGSSRILSIQNALAKEFGADRISHAVNPDEAVCTGAALFAANGKFIDLSIEEVTRYNILTTLVRHHKVEKEIIIPKNSLFSERYEKVYRTVKNNIGYFEDTIYEEDELNHTYRVLAKIGCDNVTEQEDPVFLKYIFRIDENGILYYHVEEVESKRVLVEDNVMCNHQ